MESLTKFTQTETSGHTVFTDSRELNFWLNKLYPRIKDYYSLLPIDKDRIIYHIYNDQRWGENRFNNYKRTE